MLAEPRRSAAPATRTTKSRRAAVPVTTSPSRTRRLTFKARTPLTRTLPYKISFAASDRVFTSLAHQSHLSSRWPCICRSVALWAPGREIAAELGEHGEGRCVGRRARPLLGLRTRRGLAMTRALRLPFLALGS